ncbi:hypothetical protein [Deinococcus metallilatus]|uniref:Uncharacterized protein n=3 Tax=Deinococcus metallilatus TaxID=1211322 RepID=A0AAJ5F0B7_9DEIO|nr:hypothetical protein [Deinococcus metallilatus]RXJ08047.1 hypothetical protein ERJ73_19545 [Deinococcus metallilatus]TLK20529.1 hypothetical protein FCS05_20090 [Deinococcus metallilatus]
MGYEDAVALFKRNVDAQKLTRLCQTAASGRQVDPSVDLGELPDGVRREWGSTRAYFRLPSLEGPVMAAVMEGFTPPAYAELPEQAPGWDAVSEAGTAWARAVSAFGSEVAVMAPRRSSGQPWYVADVSGGFPASSLPLLAEAREALGAYARVFVPWAMKEATR